MKELTISFNFYRKHRMPQYDFNLNFIAQEEEKEVWLRVPIKIYNEYYSLSFFIKSRIDIKHFKNEELMWKMTTQLFSELLSKQNFWNILDMQDLNIPSTFKIDESKEKLSNEYQITINEKLHSYFQETYQEVLKIQEVLKLLKKYLSNIFNFSSNYGFSFYEHKINECIRFLEQCSRNISKHGEKIYFDKQLSDIKTGFRELIKRKRVNNDIYQQYLNIASTAVYRLPIPNEWDDYIPIANESLLNFLKD